MMHSRGIFYNTHWMGYGFWLNGWNWLIGLGVLLLIVALTYFIVKRNKRPNAYSNALETLKINYAKGEITEDEYNKRKNVIENK